VIDLLDSLKHQYTAALESHLADVGEAGFHQAYELGRKALSDGLSVLDVTMLHHESLCGIVAWGASADERSRMQKAADFLAEALSPFEMALRGYREANARLTMLNETLKQAHAMAEAANSELEAFSYSVAHDLRAPVRHIDGFAELLQNYTSSQLDEKAQRYVSTIAQSAKQMGSLIDDLLAFSRMARTEMSMTRVNLDELVKDVLARLQPDLQQRTVIWNIHPLPEVYGDRPMLRQVFTNLISNAVKYTRCRAEATIEVGSRQEREGKDQVVVFVRDNGAGFDMQYAHKLFGVFQRLHTAGEYDGTGVGLANVRRIIHRHGGKTWAEAAVNEGATFYFSLPWRETP
jgi:light-regulated signal transduction histidine kinase (bacteriophytochrome)